MWYGLEGSRHLNLAELQAIAKKEKAMFEDINEQEALRRAMQTEKDAMHFYRLLADRIKDADAKRVFALLSGEEREHAGHFFEKYSGVDIPSLAEYIDSPSEHESEWLMDLDKVIREGLNEQKALELAMQKELELEKDLLRTAAEIQEPGVRGVFELNARETRRHYEMIESEYARVMGMVHESDMDIYVRE